MLGGRPAFWEAIRHHRLNDDKPRNYMHAEAVT